MGLTEELKQQTLQYLTLLQQPVEFCLSVDDSDNSHAMVQFIQDICSLDDKLTYTETSLPYTPSFGIKLSTQHKPNIVFAGIPLGHEYNSFILALLQVSGHAPKITAQQHDEILALNQSYTFTTYMNLTCHNCPEVVQAINIIAALNSQVTHYIVDGSLFQDEVSQKDIMSVPTVWLDNDYLFTGKQDLNHILSLISTQHVDPSATFANRLYDMLIIGGGPAGTAAAIYGARKGLTIGIVAPNFGGQITETDQIENVIGTPVTTGAELAQSLEAHMKQYDIDLIQASVTQFTEQSPHKITLDTDVTLSAKTLILSTGARWRHLNIPGETRLAAKGVAYCTHCDAPLFKDKRVAVIGGGNSGVEAAIDLSAIASHVTLLEYNHTLKADNVLQQQLQQKSNVTIYTDVQSEEIEGDTSVETLVYTDLTTQETHSLPVDGIFIQIGLSANTDMVPDFIEKNHIGEIITDRYQATNVDSIFAAGDCADSPYKQIIISMGEGATAALSAFQYLIRH